MDKKEAIECLYELGYNELIYMVNEMYIDQYGQPADNSSFKNFKRKDLVEWVLKHYEWNIDENLWESKMSSPLVDFSEITDDDLSPLRILH